MANEINAPNELFHQWRKQHFTIDKIKFELENKGYFDDQINELLGSYKKWRMKERTNQGLIFIGIGCFLGLISCLFTILGVFPEGRSFILYGLTTAGISLAMYGGYLIFE